MDTMFVPHLYQNNKFMQTYFLTFLLFLLLPVTSFKEKAIIKSLATTPPAISEIIQDSSRTEALPSKAKKIFQSIDNGQTWQDVSAGLPADLLMENVFAIDGEIFLHSESRVFTSNALQVPPVWKKAMLPDPKITAIYPGQTGLFAYGFGAGFFQDMQGGGIWLPINSTFEGKAVNTFLEARDGSIYIGSDNGIFKSVDGFKTWKQVFEGDLISSLVEANGVLMGEGVIGLVRSTDHGQHWEYINKEEGRAIKTGIINGGIAAIFIGGQGSNDHVNAYGMKNSLQASSDKGMTWQHIDNGFPSTRNIFDIEAAGAYLFCSLNTGIYRSADQGKTWTLVYPSKEKERFEMAVSGKTVFAILVSGGC